MIRIDCGRLLRSCASRTAATVLLALLLPLPASARPGTQRVRVSAWYWLNSVPRSQWLQDFKAIKSLGVTDVVLVWGMDGAAFQTRTVDSHRAIEAARKEGLGSYLFVWHARYTSLHHDPEFEQVDTVGERLYAFDAFNPEWRHTQWKLYLETVAREYGRDPGMAGYIFDNSFAIGHVGAVDGPAPAAGTSYISYGNAERKLFGQPPPVSPADPAWAAWTEARQQWWADWARDTREAIRAVDRNLQHAIVLEDGENTIDPDSEARAGLSLRRVAPYFDIVSAYWAPHYSNSNEQIAGEVTNYLGRMRAALGDRRPISLSLRLSDDATEQVPGHANTPTLEQIKAAISAGLAAGVKRIDLYGYRMGIYHIQNPGWTEYLPGDGRDYPLTGQIEGKFIVDRPELWAGLKQYLTHIEIAPGR